MAVSKVSSDPRDDRYEVRLYNPAGGRYKKTVHGKRAAERHEAEIRLLLADGAMAAGPARTATVRELMEQILAAKPNLAQNTLRSYRTSLRLHLYPTLGDVQVRKLTSGLRLGAVLEQVEARSGREARRAVEALLRLLLRTAVREGILPRNPLDGVPFPRRVRVRGLPYAPDMTDARRVVDHVGLGHQHSLRGEPQMIAAMVTLLIGTGLRIGELLALDLDTDHDVARGTLQISRQLLYLPREGFAFGPPKTDDSGVRTVPLPAFASAALARTVLACGQRAVTLPWQTSQGPPRTQRLVFHALRSAGQPFRPQTLQDAVRRAGLTLRLPGALHPHGFRHRYTALLHDAGVPQIVIDEVTGHLPGGSVTMRTYTRAMDGGRAKARAAIEQAWSDASPGRLAAERGSA